MKSVWNEECLKSAWHFKCDEWLASFAAPHQTQRHLLSMRPEQQLWRWPILLEEAGPVSTLAADDEGGNLS